MDTYTDESNEGESSIKPPNKMLGEGTEKPVSNGNQLDDTESDRTAQVLKDIAILNGQTPEFNDDHIKSFTSKEPAPRDSADNEANTDSGINSVSSNCVDAKAENGNDAHSDDEKMDTSVNSEKAARQPRSESPQSSSSDVVEIPDDSEDEEMEADESVVKLDSENSRDAGDSDKETKVTASASPDKDDAVVVIDKDDESNDSCSVKSETPSADADKKDKKGKSNEVSDVYDKVLEELDSDEEKPNKENGAKISPSANKKDKPSTSVTLREVYDKAPVKALPQNYSKPSDKKDDSGPNLKIDHVISLKKPDQPKKKASKPSAKLSNVNQALAKPQGSDMRPMAGMLAQIGFDIVREHVYKDLIHQQTKKKSTKELSDREEEQLVKLSNHQKEMAKKNESLNGNKVLECAKCSYISVSKHQIELHKEHVHQGEHGSLQCAMCENFQTKNKTAMAYHMEAEHNRLCRWLLMPLGFYVCPLCRFDSNTQNQYQRHRGKCDRLFKLQKNLEPVPADSDIPVKPLIKPKPAIPPPPLRKISQLPPRMNPAIRPQQTVGNILNRARPQALPRANAMPATRPVHGITLNANQLPAPGQTQIVQIQGQLYTLYYANGQAFLTPATQGNLVQGAGVRPLGQLAPQTVVPARAAAPRPPRPGPASSQLKGGGGGDINDISRMIAARAIAQAAHGKAQANAKANRTTGQKTSQTLVEKKAPSAVFPKDPGQSFQICEICGGFVKDSDSLRIHFYWAHKIDIPKAVFNKKLPHLICGRQNRGRECMDRFWTYQGLSRHREIAHAEGDSPASKLQTRQCFMCGEQGVVSLIGHLRTQHYLQVGTWLRSFKCVCCGMQFQNRAGLENHLLGSHGQVFLTRGLIDQLANFSRHVTPRSNAAAAAVPTGMFPNSAKTTHGVAAIQPAPAAIVYPCNSCDKDFTSRVAFEAHQKAVHSFKCSRCPQRFSSRAFLNKHYTTHRNDRDECPLCKEKVVIGRPYVRHMRRTHLKDCSLVLPKMPADKEKFYVDKYQSERDKRRQRVVAEARAKPGVIVLDSDDEGERQQQQATTASSSKRVGDHSTSPEPPAKRARRETSEEITVLDLDEDGNHIGTESSSTRKSPVDLDDVAPETSDAKEETAESKEENMETVENKEETMDTDAPSPSVKKDKVEEVFEIDGETIIVQKEDD